MNINLNKDLQRNID